MGVGRRNEGCEVGTREFSRVIIVLPDYSQKLTTRPTLLDYCHDDCTSTSSTELPERASPFQGLLSKPLGLPIEGCLPPSEEVVGFNIGFPMIPEEERDDARSGCLLRQADQLLSTSSDQGLGSHKTSCERLPSTPRSRWCSYTYPSAKAKSAGWVWEWVRGWTWGNVGRLGIMDRSRRGLDLENHVCIPPPWAPAESSQGLCAGRLIQHVRARNSAVQRVQSD